MAHESLRQKHEACEAAEEIIRLSANNSSDYLQAKAIIAGFVEDSAERGRQLKGLLRRATNHRHFTVAGNIALDLARQSGDTEEILKHLASVRTARDFEYNYVRATIRRVETLLDAGRGHEITSHDIRDLDRSYRLAYSQRLTGVFDWCHRVYWKFLEARSDYPGQRSLFVHSSFLWRLDGNVSEEAQYAAKLASAMVSASRILAGAIDPVMRYCRNRIATLNSPAKLVAIHPPTTDSTLRIS